MLGTASNIMLLPNYQIFVIVALFIFFLIFLLMEWFIPSGFWQRLAEFLATAVFIVFCMVWSVHNDAAPLLIDKSMRFQRVTGEIDIRLLDVRSLEGWGEGESDVGSTRERLVHGDHRVNQAQPDPARPNPVPIIDRVLDHIGAPHRGEEIARMSQEQWVSYLRGLNSIQRRQIGRIPFAVIEIRSDDDRIERIVMFRNDRHTVRDQAGNIVGRICVDRVFNVADTVSGEREAVRINHGYTCQ